MTDDRSTPAKSSEPSQTQSSSSKPTPLRCFTGAFIAAPMAYGLYILTAAIAHTFAEKPIPNTNVLARNISVLVRTLVVGTSALGTGIFAITTLGLILLGLQLLLKKESSHPSES